MSSVQNFEECPVCKGMCFVETDIKTQETFEICFTCGRNERIELCRDEKNNVIFDENNKLTYQCIINEGYGVAHLIYTEGRGRIFLFHEKPTEEEIQELSLLFNDVDVDRNISYLLLWDAANQKAVNVIGPLPPTMEEFIRSEAELEQEQKDSIGSPKGH